MTEQTLAAIEKSLSARLGGLWLRKIPELETSLARYETATLPLAALLKCAAHHAAVCHYGKAANWVTVACLLHPHTAWPELRRKGLFRCSKNDFNSRTALGIASLLLEHATALRLSTPSVTYLRSTIALLRFAEAARAEFISLIKDLRRERYTLLQSCLITLDFLFMQDSHPDLDFGITWSIAPWKKEQLAEGLSLVWALAESHLGLNRRVAGLWNSPAIVAGHYLKTLQRAAWLREFSQTEILIDIFDYHCEARDDKSVVLAAPYAELEKSIRYGYIGYYMRQAIFTADAIAAEVISWRDIGTMLHASASRAGRIEMMETLPPRVRFHIPDEPQFVAIIRDRSPMKDELVPLADAYWTWNLSSDELHTFAVGRELSMGDVLRVQRLTGIVASYVAAELAGWRSDLQRMINSVSSIFRGDDALREFLGLALEPEAVRSFVELFRWPSPQGSATVFDVQYRPLIDAGGEWHVPIHILSRSTLMRSALLNCGARPANVIASLVERPIVEELRRQGCPAAENITLEIAGEHVEIDVAAIVDDVLLILECKASLLPCNIFELRTSYEAILKAVSQLNRIVRLLATPDGQAKLLARLGGSSHDLATVLTGIVVENRVFGGLKMDGHLVVALGHLLNVLEGGDIKFGDVYVPIRSREPLAAALQDFMHGDLYSSAFDSMLPHHRTLASRSGSLVYESFYLDVSAFAKKHGVELATDQSDGDQGEGSHLAPP